MLLPQRLTLDTYLKIIPVNRMQHYKYSTMYQLLFCTCSCTHVVTDLKLLLNQDDKTYMDVQ
jgi:hypothetical protein